MPAHTLPEPFVPADCDLTDFKYIPIEIERLRRSSAWRLAKRRPELAFYMLNLWIASWHEVPAASLEDDDDALADLALCDHRKWQKIKADVLRGWVKCSDNRLYHSVVSEKALEAHEHRRKQSRRGAAGAAARWNKDNSSNANALQPECDSPQEALLGNGKGIEGKGIEGSVPNGTGADAPPDDPVKALFDRGAAILGEKNRSILGKARKAHGDLIVLQAIQACEEERPSDPTAFFLKCLSARTSPGGTGELGFTVGVG